MLPERAKQLCAHITSRTSSSRCCVCTAQSATAARDTYYVVSVHIAATKQNKEKETRDGPPTCDAGAVLDDCADLAVEDAPGGLQLLERAPKHLREHRRQRAMRSEAMQDAICNQLPLGLSRRKAFR